MRIEHVMHNLFALRLRSRVPSDIIALNNAIKALEILSNADNIIESNYGCLTLEGYADVIDQMKEVFKEVDE